MKSTTHATDERWLETLTTGIVSALDRALLWKTARSSRVLIHTDAMIGPMVRGVGAASICDLSVGQAPRGSGIRRTTVKRVVPQLTIELTVELEAAVEPATL